MYLEDWIDRMHEREPTRKDGSLLHILLLRGILAFGNKVAKNDARVIGRLVPPLSPLTHEVLISLRSNDYFVGTP